jgi:CDP-diacylglycerol--serine O-phosphatidyltransferase
VKRHGWARGIRRAVPQLLTASRLALAAAAIVAAFDARLYLAATLITLGAVTDGLDGVMSRWLAAATPFGALFDYFSDYLCFVVAPWALLRGFLPADGGLAQEAWIGLPLVTGAIRYARNGLIVIEQTPNVHDLPGLGTIFFAFLCVSAVFLDARRQLGDPWFSAILPIVVVVFSLLMLAPMRYPKLPRITGIAVSLLVALMPFFASQILASVMLVLGLIYAAVGPVFSHFSRRQPHVTADLANARRDGAGRQTELLP